jgi:membrane-bound serine protease (ClpP class)
VLSVQDAIGPATSNYIRKGIAYADSRNAALIVIEMDTPGGLDSAMREIIQAILASRVAVVSFVYPQGARAASAGTYILYASHVAAMAPATNTGAATPVAIGGSPAPAAPPQPDGDGAASDSSSQDGNETTEASDSEGDSAGDGDTATGRPAPQPATASERKAVNDAVAYIRSLAEQRGRNADWAEGAVRSGDSISAQAALDNNIIDIVAADIADLLRQLNGREVDLSGTPVVLATDGLVLERFEPDWRTRLLAVISNPTLAYMLMLLGIYGLIFEGYNPGAIVPGVVGAIALLLALFSLQVLPVNYAGMALMLLGIILMLAEFFVPSFGALGIGGIAAFVFGSVILFDTDVPGFAVSTPLIAAIATTGAGALMGIVFLAMKARGRPVVSGSEELLRARASALESFAGSGAVWAHGERWDAHSDAPVSKGQALRITRVEGLVLHVEPLQDTPAATGHQQ